MDKLFIVILVGVISFIAFSFYIWKKSSAKKEFIVLTIFCGVLYMLIGTILYQDYKEFLTSSQEEITAIEYKNVYSIKNNLEEAKLKNTISIYEATSEKKGNYIDVFLDGYSSDLYINIEETNELSNLIKASIEDNKIDGNEYKSLLSMIHKYISLSETRKVDELKQNIKQK